jgi:hypothetical protein
LFRYFDCETSGFSRTKEDENESSISEFRFKPSTAKEVVLFALAEVQRNWLIKLRTDKGLAQAVNLARQFIMSSQGKP